MSDEFKIVLVMGTLVGAFFIALIISAGFKYASAAQAGLQQCVVEGHIVWQKECLQ